MKIGNYKLKIIFTAIAVLAISLATFYFLKRPVPSDMGAIESAVITSEATPKILAEIKTYEYTQTYSDSTYRFSFKHPQGFTVTQLSGTGGDETILLIQSSDKKVGIQAVISPYGEDVDITAALIRAQLPNIKIDDAQTVEVGASRLGVAFMSDSQAFGGKSREVWFVWNKNLYQISTYAEYDEFLKKMFSTWQFTK